MNSKSMAICGVLCALAVFSWGCGYEMTRSRGGLPDHVRTVAVPVMDIRANEPGLEREATRLLIEEFNRRPELRVAAPGKADAVLHCVIDQVDLSALSYGSDEHATERRVILSMGYRLTDVKTGKAIAQADRLWFQEGYLVVKGDPVATDYNRKEALRKILANLAEKINEGALGTF